MLSPQAEKWGTRPLVPHRAMPMLCRTSQSYILAKLFVITQMGISYIKHRNPPLLSQATGEGATQISSFIICLIARAY